MILGAGSASFEILRYLADRLPILLAPRWVDTPVQPIGIRNVLNYLQGCLEHDEVLGQIFDIGGPEVVSYRRLFKIYAEEARSSQAMDYSRPFLNPRFSSYWIHLITPIPSSIARPLAEGLRNPVICQDNRIREIIPQELLDCRQTIRLALERIEQQRLDTCWMDARANIPQEWFYCGDTPLCRRNHPGIGLPDPTEGRPGGSLETHRENRREDRLVFRSKPLENKRLV